MPSELNAGSSDMPAAPRPALNVCTLCATMACGGERSIRGCSKGPRTRDH